MKENLRYIFKEYKKPCDDFSPGDVIIYSYRFLDQMDEKYCNGFTIETLNRGSYKNKILRFHTSNERQEYIDNMILELDKNWAEKEIEKLTTRINKLKEDYNV